MTTIRANCRDQLSVHDLAFIAQSIGVANDKSQLADLLTDAEILDAALESDRLLKALLESPENLAVSPQLYFYVATRHMLRNFDRPVADYVAHVLVEFLKVERASRPLMEHAQAGRAPLLLTDMLIALQSASTEQAFEIRVHVGDYSLFLAGVFPQHIHERAAHRGAPEINFYEEIGRTNYRLAADHQIAKRNALADIYRTMAEHFTEVRVGLNQMADRLLCLETSPV